MRNLTLWEAVAFASELGVAFAAAVLIGVFVGHIADDLLGHEVPSLTMLGAFVGLAAGVYGSIQMAQWLTRPRKE